MSNESYMYLFTRRDLSHQQQIIQTAHATHQMASKHKEEEIPNAVLIGIHSADSLYEMGDYLQQNNIPFEIFYEPDIDAHTAIATYPLRGKERKPLLKFGLM